MELMYLHFFNFVFAAIFAFVSLSPTIIFSRFLKNNFHFLLNGGYGLLTVFINTILVVVLYLGYKNGMKNLSAVLKEKSKYFLLIFLVFGFGSWFLIIKTIFVLVIPCFITLMYVFLSPYFEVSSQESIKGAKLIYSKNKRSKTVVCKAIKNNCISFAGVQIKQQSEPLHFSAIGTTGTGKSTAIKELIYTSKKRGDKHVICDPDGGYFDEFGISGDLLLNPLNSRSVNWDYLGEIEKTTDHKLLASMLIPESSKGDDEWRDYARQLLASASEKWIELDLGKSAQFFKFLGSCSQAELAAVCEGTFAKRFFEDGNERMLGSILSTLSPFIEPLRLVGESSGPSFSIREWVRSGSGSLFIPYKANEIASLKNLISAWLGIAIYENLSLELNQANTPTWYIMDELDFIGRVFGLKDALARLRKYNGRVVLGFQSISQLRSVYSDAEANTIIENCGNKLILRCDSSERGGTADFASKLIGERDTLTTQYNSSYGSSSGEQIGSSSSNSSSGSNTSEKREYLIMASQIMQLPNLSGYLRVAGEPIWRTVKFDYIDYKTL